jgi:tRNA pseudouridine38-40 synthase
MPLYALTLEYDGSPFVGWQRQGNGLSVQQVLEEAAAKLNDGIPPTAIAAGRTDAGVHAEGQVAQLAIARDLPPERLREALNFHTRPHPVAVVRAALEAGRVWHVQQPLDAGAMHAAAQRLLGKHDFSAFRAAACQAKSALRTLDRLDVVRQGDEVVILAEARSFLHHQIRNLAGTLLEVGQGKRGSEWPRRVLDSRDRSQAGQTAPPEGLCFSFVRYPEEPAWV